MSEALAALGSPALLVLAPLVAALGGFAWPRAAAPLGLLGSGAAALMSLALAARLLAEGTVVVALGGWAPPLGVALRADGLSAAMVAMTALVGGLVGLSALAAYGAAPSAAEPPARARLRAAFWPLWMLALAGLNALFLADDVFNLYVALELLGLAAVGLTALSGTREALRAAFTYLLASLLGGLLFLLGVDYLYAAHGRVDLGGLSQVAGPGPATAAASALMLGGLALKAALFPLHVWLPAAHANATAPASALLSALVVKGALYLALRLWLDLFGPAGAAGTLLGLLGAGAVLWGSVRALQAERLKLVVAYSTVAQVGLVALAFAVAGAPGAEAAWSGAVLLMIAHAAAKAAMFLAAGRLAEAAGGDALARIGRGGAPRAALPAAAFALAAVSLVGLPPSGGFAGKWLLLDGALRSGAWPWAAAILAGTGLSAAYLARPLARLLRAPRPAADAPPAPAAASAWADAPALVLALAAALMGLLAPGPLALLAVGEPFAGGAGS